MTKFKIIETQIDNFNETNNQFNRFDDGLNIICGPNEIGKSTLMNFIRNIFIRKNDAKGYIKCSVDNQEFSLRAEKSKIKENEKYLNIINAYGYNTGFVIDLDDLMFAKKADAEELLNTINDSSGNAVNIKQLEYENYIYGKKQKFPLTPKNSESSTFKKQFDNLKKITQQIKELQAKEYEYTEVCNKIENLDNEIENFSKLDALSEIIFQKNKLVADATNIKINSKLIENKDDFESVRESYGALNSSHQKYEELNKNLKENKNICDEKLKELNSLETFNEEDVESFDLSSETYKYGCDLTDNLKELKSEKKRYEEDIKDLTKKVDELDFETTSTKNQLENLNIPNIDEYKTNRDMLESHKEHYSDLMNKARNSANINTKSAKLYNETFFLIFLGLLLAALGSLILYWNTPMRIPIVVFVLTSLMGIYTSCRQNLERKKNIGQDSYTDALNKQAKEIIELCQKCNFKLNKGENFTVKIGSYIKNMNDKISEYKIIENDLLKVRVSLEREKRNLENKKDSLKQVEKKTDELNIKINEFLSKNKIKNLDNYKEIFEKIKDIKYIKNELQITQKSIDEYDKDLDKFVENINIFIEKSELNNFQKLNKYDFESFDKTLSELRKILDENISHELLLNELNSKINNYDCELEKFPQEYKDNLSDINEEQINLIKSNLQEKREERGKFIQQKEILENVVELFSLKNKKNIELNNLNDGLKKLIQKEIIYNLIKLAKEKFNESQPNLISAKQYLSEITGGKYSEINIENKTISGENTPEKDWDKLSRGTKEQLYLALRLGFANNYSKDINGNDNGIPNLPLIIDDAFVNFDEKRTTSILKCLENFSANNQVLYFTCHANTVKNILKKEKINHKLIEL